MMHYTLIFVIHFLQLCDIFDTQRLKYHKSLCIRKIIMAKVLDFVKKSLKLDIHSTYIVEVIF